MDPKHEQTTNEAPSRRSRGNSSSETNPQAEMKIHKAEDDVLGVIENVETQLGALRHAHEEHRKAMTDLAQRKRDMEEQVNEVESRETELVNREVELAEMRQDFENRELNLVQRASGLEQRESKIASKAELLERQEADLVAKDHELEKRIQELDNQLAGLSKRKAELNAIEEEVKIKLAREDESASQLASATQALEEARSTLNEMSGQIESLNTELTQSRKGYDDALAQLTESQRAHQASAADLKASVSKLRGREIELEERSRTLEDLAEKAGSYENDLSEAVVAYEKKLTIATEQLENERVISDGLRSELEQSKNAQASLQSESTSKLDELNKQLESSKAKLDAMRADAQELGQESKVRVVELTQELGDARTQIESLNTQLAEIAGCADEEISQQRDRVAELESQIQSYASQLEEAIARSNELQANLNDAPEIDSVELDALREQLASAQRQSDESSSMIELANTELVRLQELVHTSDEQAENAQARVGELEDQSASLFATIEELNAQLEEIKHATPKAVPDEWSNKRKSRLKRMRRMLTGDAEKIRRATEALRTRYEQCEQVLIKRSELAEAYEAIASAQRKYHKREVRSGVFLGLIGMSAITVVLAATGWFVSGRIAPGMYAAKVTMAAASGDKKLSEADMGQWEAYITELTSDPRFLEVASDRMKRRGIGELSVAGELAKEMSVSLDVASAMPGTIVMEYRGEGAARSQRVLDTFAVALASAANNARARRADSAMTVIEEAALAGTEPLDTRRIEMAGMVFGGGMFSTLLIGGVFWKRLSAAKAKFESDSRLEGLLDDSQWQMPT